MKSIALVILPNQNEVSKSEIERIRRAVKRDFPESRLKIYANDDAENLDRTKYQGFPDVNEDDVMVFETSDSNYSISASLQQNYSTISSANTWHIQLN
jgi:hypothetical protein